MRIRLNRPGVIAGSVVLYIIFAQLIFKRTSSDWNGLHVTRCMASHDSIPCSPGASYFKQMAACFTGGGKLSLYIAFLILLVPGGFSFSQNLPAASGANWVGLNNAYTQPINGSAVNNVLQYRKVATTAVNTVNGGGQWWCTLNAKPSGGDVTNQVMDGGSGNGFLLTSGGGAGVPGDFTNTWGLNVVGQVGVNAISPIHSSFYGTVEEMGISMAQAGYYTFVMQDSGLDKNSNLFVGFTTSAPITINHSPASQRWVLSDRSSIILAGIPSVPSAQEKIYVRYKTGANDFSTGVSFISPAARISNDTAIMVLPPLAAGSTVNYYIFSSTLSQSELQSLSEPNKTLACLRYNDNAGLNYNYSIPALASLYYHSFDTAPTASSPYTITPNTFNGNFSAGSSVWTCPTFFSTGPTQNVAPSSLSPATALAINGTNSITLTFNTQPNYYVSLSTMAFWRSSNQNNNNIASITINGVTIASNVNIPRNANTSSGSTSITLPSTLNNITGSITVVINLVAGANGGNFYLDNFQLLGNITTIPDFLGFTWIGTSNSNWNTASNWAPTGIPGANDNVIIATLPAVNITGNQSVKNLTLTGTGVLQIASGGSLAINGSLNYTNTATYGFNCNSTVFFNSAAPQTIPALQYGNLNIDGGPRQLESSVTTKICGNYTASSSGATLVESVVEFNGTTAQAIQTNPASFLNLVVSNQAAAISPTVPLTIIDGGNLQINIQANLNMGSNLLTLTGATSSVEGTLTTDGAITGADATTLTLESTGVLNYNASRSGMPDLGTIPTAQWDAGATLSISGLTNPANGSWFSGGFNQAFSNLTWNTPGLTTNPALAVSPLFINGTLSVQSTGTGQLVLGGATDVDIYCTNLSVTGGKIYFSDGTGTTNIYCSKDYIHTGGLLTYSGPNSFHYIHFNGSTQQALTGNATGTNYIYYVFDNPAGFVLTGNIPMYGNVIIRNGAFSGTGKFAYNSFGGLVYDVTIPRTTTSYEWPATSAPYDVVINNGVSISLHDHRTIDLLRLNGKMILGAYNLTLNDSVGDGVEVLVPFSDTNMVVTNGAGKLGKAIATTTNLPRVYLFPVGNSSYHPVTYTFNTNSVPKDLLVGVVESTNPNISSVDYISGVYYSTDLSIQSGSYSYEVSYNYEAGSEQGNAGNIKIGRWNGLLWTTIPGSSIVSPLLNSGPVTETTAPLYAPAEWTGISNIAVTYTTYTWNNIAGGSWTTATNWQRRMAGYFLMKSTEAVGFWAA